MVLMTLSDLAENWPLVLIGVAFGTFAAVVVIQVILANHREYLRTHPKEAVYRPYQFPPEWPYYKRAAIILTLIYVAAIVALFFAPGTGLPPFWYRATLLLSCWGLTFAVAKSTSRKIKAGKGSAE